MALCSVKGKAGLLILIHKNLPCEVLSVETDEDGWVVKLKLFSRELILSNIYAPNSPSKYFFQGLTSCLAPYVHLPLLVGGNFNLVMHLLKDKFQGRAPTVSPCPLAITPLMQFAELLQLIDIWGLLIPLEKNTLSFPHFIIVCPG